MKRHKPEALELARQIGLFMEYWGFKQIHGRVWTLMFLSPNPIDANFLQKHLEISKALTSMTLKDLLHYNVIVEIEKGQPGTQKYRINENITEVILDVIRRRELKLLNETMAGYKALEAAQKKSASEDIDPNRLKDLGQMIDTSLALLTSMTSLELVDFNSFKETTTIN